MARATHRFARYQWGGDGFRALGSTLYFGEDAFVVGDGFPHSRPLKRQLDKFGNEVRYTGNPSSIWPQVSQLRTGSV